MTRESQLLDPILLTRESPLILYRIVREAYANLTGVGAAKYPGRWNLAKQEAIYTGTNTSTVQLEKLVHTQRDEMPQDLAIMRIALTAEWNPIFGSESGRVRSPSVLIYTSLVEANHPEYGVRSRLREQDTVLAVAVPSVVDAHWNVVLYPNAPEFRRRVEVIDIEPFEFDPRLFLHDVKESR